MILQGTQPLQRLKKYEAGVEGGGVWQMDPNLYILSEVDIFLWTLAFLLVNLQ